METMDFQKTSARSLPGKKKAAILFGEIGPAAAEAVMGCLNAEEKRLLLKAMRKLGTRYDPHNMGEVRDELTVLETLEKYGKIKGIYRDVAGEKRALLKTNSTPVAKIRNAISDYPDRVASVLSHWLNTGDK